MRFLSYFLLFAVAVSAPSAIRAQYDDNVVHINAVSMPFIVADASNVIDTTSTNDNQNTLQTGTLIAPSLVYSQDDSPIVSSLTSPMLIAVDASGETEGEEDGLEGQSLLVDYQNDDRNTIDLFTTINEELHENGVESLLETMDSEDMMIASAPIDGDDDTETEGEEDEIDAFDIAAAEGEGEGISRSEENQMKLKEKKEKKYRRGLLRRGVRKGMMRGMRRFAPWRRFGREKGLPEGLRGRKRLQTMLKLMVLSKKLKALDMKMNLMRLLTRAIRMRMMEKGMGRGMVSLRNLRNKMMRKLMALKLIKLMHLLYQSTLGRPVYHRSGMRLSSRFLLRHLLRHALRRPLLARMLLGLRAKSFTMRSVMRSFLNNLKYLLRKVFLLKKKALITPAAGNRHRLYVRADRAIVNVGDGNEFKPIFYRSRAAPRVSVDDSTIPVRINVPAPGVIRRLYPGRTRQERRSDY